LLDTLVAHGVLNGYAIDRNLDHGPIRLTPHEVKLFGVDPAAIDWEVECESVERPNAIQRIEPVS
jgi:hypothetical protein